MAPRPTKTPTAVHAQQNVQNRYPPPQNPNNNTIQNQQPLLQSSESQPNLHNTNYKDGDTINETRKSTEGPNDNPENKPVYYRSKSCFRWIVLFLSCWAMFGSYYCYDNPTALNTQIQAKSGYNLSDTQYALLYSVYSFPNIILPLFGGGLVDKIGAELSLLIFLSLVTIGQAIFAFAASISSYPLMLVGRGIYGLGGESLCVAESALLAVYFAGSEVAFAMGLNLSLGRAGSSLNDFATVRIYDMKDSIPEALWAGFLLLCICLGATVIMIVLDRWIAKKKEKAGYFVPQAHSGEVVQLSDIKEFNIQYWLLTISCIVVYGCVLPWNNIGGQLIQLQYDKTEKQSNTYLALPYLVSAFCVPFFGFAVDLLGRRAELLVVSTIALATTHFLFAWVPSISPLYPLICLGIAYSIYASAIWPSIALVVKESKLGTAYGFITAVQNGGLALFPVIVSVLTDKNKHHENKKYYHVEMFFFGLAGFGAFVGLILLCLDYKRGAPLSKPSIKRGKDKEEEKDEDNKRTNLLDDDKINTDTNISLQNQEIIKTDQ